MKSFFAIAIALSFSLTSVADVPSSSRSRAAIERSTAYLNEELENKGFSLGDAVFLQITKTPAKLTVFVQSETGAFQRFKTYPICAYSGGLGPKKQQGDRKSPEGFYQIRPSQMNPASSYHLSFNLGYPNAFDRSHGYSGDYLMVHGSCVSIGCYAMTDEVIEEIWTLMTAAFEAGQRHIDVHIFPYRMNWPLRVAPMDHPDYPFWRSLTPAWKIFSLTGRVPVVSVANGQYVVTDPGP